MQSRQPREPLRPASFLSWLSQVLALALLLAVQGPALALDETKPGAAEPAPSGDVVTVPIGYLEQEVKRPLPISRLNIPPDDLGVAGAELALKDNNTTGRFTKQQFTLDVVRVPVGDDAVAVLSAGESTGGVVTDGIEEAGYAGWEIVGDGNYRLDNPACFSRIGEVIASTGLGITVHAPYGDLNLATLNDPIWRESIRQICTCIEHASEITDRVTIHPGYLSPVGKLMPQKVWDLQKDAVVGVEMVTVGAVVSMAISLLAPSDPAAPGAGRVRIALAGAPPATSTPSRSSTSPRCGRS